MTKEELQRLYKEKVLVHSKRPYHFNKIDTANIEISAYNPMCGDKFQLQLKVDNDIIDSAYFTGFGCAVSKASTSILMKKIEGMPVNNAILLCKDFISSLMDKSDILLNDSVIDVLLELKNFEGRMDCIKLSWEALLDELRDKA